MSETPNRRQVAIALQYEAGTRQAPRVTARGQGLLAEAMIALARENDVLIDANPQLAQALSGVEIDQTIPIELFEAVAEVIGFVLRAQGRVAEHRERLLGLAPEDEIAIAAPAAMNPA